LNETQGVHADNFVLLLILLLSKWILNKKKGKKEIKGDYSCEEGKGIRDKPVKHRFIDWAQCFGKSIHFKGAFSHFRPRTWTRTRWEMNAMLFMCTKHKTYTPAHRRERVVGKTYESIQWIQMEFERTCWIPAAFIRI
jgi:hypothetical protein